MRRTPRDYQEAARDAIYAYFANGGTGNPVVALPTGTGKSLIPPDFIEKVLEFWPGQRFAVLVHVKELVAQNYATMIRQWPGAPAGVVSAGLGRKEWGRPITFGGIGSVAKHAKRLGHIDVLFVDECHLVSDNEDSMYRKLIDELLKINPHMKVVGLSATPWRVGTGHIVDGDVFTDVCYDATTLEAFNWFIDQGYLVPLIPRPTKTTLDTEKVGLSGGEYNQKQLQGAVDREEITAAAVEEALELAHDRQSVIVFATGIEHAEHIASYLESRGETAVVIHSKMTDAERDLRLEAFKSGKVRWAVNNNVLTTGFDHPGLDCIVMLRPTRSPGLWVQMLGRGTRPDYAEGFDLETQEGRLLAIQQSGKQNCLVLDFAGNTISLGPINDPQLPKKRGKGGGTPPVKTCKEENTKDSDGCGVYNHPTARTCINCGAEFIFEVKITDRAGSSALIAGSGTSKAYEQPVVNEFKVTRMTLERHHKIGRPDSIKVNYYCGLRRFTWYVCPEHGGIPRRKAEHWWARHGGGALPDNVESALALIDTLNTPQGIRVWENRKYPEILDWIFA
jgi:DNA repair protein RadD